MESHWNNSHVSCIDNVAIILPTKVSQFKLACLMEGHQSNSFLFDFQRRHVWLNGTKFSAISVEVSSASMYCNQAIISDILTSTHANYVVVKQHTCMPVAEKQDLQECVFVTSHQQKCILQLHPTNRNAGYSCVGSVCKSVILVPDQQPSHYCHRVSRHLYHFHVWLSTHVWN